MKTDPSGQSITVVVPVYNSQDILPELVHRLEAVLSSLVAVYEVVFVNDGSQDSSWEVICQLAKDYPWVRRINLMRNYGQHNAVLCGIRAAKHEVIVTMDDDLQNPPEEIPKLLDKLVEGYDVVRHTAEGTTLPVARSGVSGHETDFANHYGGGNSPKGQRLSDLSN